MQTIYEITFDTGTGRAECKTRKRADAAFLAFRQYVWEACAQQGLLDRPIAGEVMKEACRWAKGHPVEPIRVGSYTVTISESKV